MIKQKEKYVLPPRSHYEGLLEECLSSSPLNTPSLILLIQNLSKSTSPLPNLEFFLSSLSEPEKSHFFNQVLPYIAQLALRLPLLFPTLSLPRLTTQTTSCIELTREQVACLVSHMFLGTLEKGDVVPYWPNYLVYYESVSEVSRVYLRVIMRYFEKLEAKNVRLEEKVRFYRKYEKEEVSWKDSNNLLCDLIVKVDGEIGDSEGYLEVDFANAVLSFGRGGTQEEILLGMSPESHVIVLIADELTDRETILLQGITKIAKHSGFGLDLKYEGIADPWDWNRRFIIAMDAMSFPDPDPFSRCPENAQLKEQLQLEPLHRELLKVHCAFNFTSKFPEITGWPNRIATGGWGCGSFNGHHHLKSIIQILAASQCSPRTTLVYHAFGNAEFAEELQAFLASCPARSVGSIYRALLAISARLPNLLKQSSPLSLFDEIRRQQE